MRKKYCIIGMFVLVTCLAFSQEEDFKINISVGRNFVLNMFIKDPLIAKQFITTLIESDAPHVLYYTRGSIEVGLNQLDEAIVDFSKAITIKPDMADYYYSRGYVRRLQERYEDAIKDYDIAISLNSDNDLYYFHRGFSKDCLQNQDGAFDDYSRAISLNTSIPDAYYNRGVINRRKKLYIDAINDYNQAITLVPDSSKYYNSRGNVLIDTNDIDWAEKDYLYAIKLDEKNYDPYYNLGLLYKNHKKMYHEAVVYFTKAIELGCSSLFVYYNRAEAYSSLNEYDLAIKDYEKVLELDPENFGAKHGRALLKLKLGDYEGAGLDYLRDNRER